MSYESMVTGLKTHLEGATGFGAGKIAVGGELIWAQGKTPVAVISQEPRLEHRWEGFTNAHLHVWRMPIEVGARWTDMTSGSNNLRDAWQAIIDRICAFPDLSNLAGVRVAEVVEANLEPVHLEVGSAKFAVVTIIVRIEEDAEYVES